MIRLRGHLLILLVCVDIFWCYDWFAWTSSNVMIGLRGHLPTLWLVCVDIFQCYDRFAWTSSKSGVTRRMWRTSFPWSSFTALSETTTAWSSGPPRRYAVPRYYCVVTAECHRSHTLRRVSSRCSGTGRFLRLPRLIFTRYISRLLR